MGGGGRRRGGGGGIGVLSSGGWWLLGCRLRSIRLSMSTRFRVFSLSLSLSKFETDTEIQTVADFFVGFFGALLNVDIVTCLFSVCSIRLHQLH